MNYPSFQIIVLLLILSVFALLRFKLLSSWRKDEKAFKTLTPDYFLEKRSRMPLTEYVKWLRRFYIKFSAQGLQYKEKGLSAPQYIINGLCLIENELESIGGQMGEDFLRGKRASEVIKSQKDSRKKSLLEVLLTGRK